MTRTGIDTSLATRPLVFTCPYCIRPIMVSRVVHLPYENGNVGRSLAPMREAIQLHIRVGCLGR